MTSSPLGFGIAVSGLPNGWPHASGPVHTTIPWSIVDEIFDPTGDWWFRETPGGLTIRFRDEGEFRVESTPAPKAMVVRGPADERGLALSFSLAVLPLTLPLFGMEPFHGAALGLPGGSALLVTGAPEAGKSTTAAALRAMGLEFLADDACAIDPDGRLWPGPPLLSARSVRAEDERFATYDGKSVVAIEDHDATPRHVQAMVVLQPGDDVPLAVRRVTGAEAIASVLGQVRSPWILPDRRRDPQFHAAAEVARHDVGLVTYEKGRHAPDEVAATIREWATRSG
jgi:hypothetical protein